MSEWANAMKGGADAASALWLQFKQDQPKLALALSVLPVTGQVTAAAEYYDAIKRGDSVDAALAAVQMLPMGGVVKGARLAGEAAQDLRRADQFMDTARTALGPSARSQRMAVGVADMAADARLDALANGVRAAGATASDAGNFIEYAQNPGSAWAAAKGQK